MMVVCFPEGAVLGWGWRQISKLSGTDLTLPFISFLFYYHILNYIILNYMK